MTVATATSENNAERLTEKVVKITITNDLMTSSIQDMSETINKDGKTPDNIVRKHPHNDVSVNSEASSVLFAKGEIQSHSSTKKTIDAAVQTEKSPETTPLQIDQPTTTTFTPSPPQPNVQTCIRTVLSSDLQNNTITSQCATSSKKERRLVRSTHQTTINNNSEARNSNTEKKQFKWRKRRNASRTGADVAQLITFHNSHRKNSNADSLNLDIDANSGDSTKRTESIQNKVNESDNQAINITDDIVEGSESGSSIVHRSINEKIVIEETSTSSVISNTTSYADSESESAKQNEVTFNEEDLRQNIMFNVIDCSMEQSLRMRCDEWVSRFVQIMEEALTQILQRDHRVHENVMPPPWTLCEAARCIKIMFRSNPEIMNASSKFLFVLDSVSDEGMFMQNEIQTLIYTNTE